MEPKIRIGTSGYSYSWNKAKPDAFEWYIVQGFNSVEINYSFYRFPQVTSKKNYGEPRLQKISHFQSRYTVQLRITTD